MKKRSAKIFRLSPGKVMSFAAAASMFLPIEFGQVSSEPRAIAGSPSFPIPSIAFWFSDSLNQACFGRSEIGVPPAFPIAVKKRHVRHKKKAHGLFAGHATRGKKRDGKLDVLWKAVDREAFHALNLTSPLSELASADLAEVPLDYDTSLRLVAGVNLQPVYYADIEPYGETVGEFKPQQFTELVTRLADLKQQAKALEATIPVKKPEPTLVAAKEPTLVIPAEMKKVSAPKEVATKKLSKVTTQPVDIQAALGPRLAAASAPVPAPVRPTKHVPQPPIAEEIEQASAESEEEDSGPRLVTVPVAPTIQPKRVATVNGKMPRIEGTAFGELDIDDDIVDWLEAKQGHLELYLAPSKSRDPQDVVFLNYQYPNERFAIDLRGLEGEYRLMASLFGKKDKTPVAQVAYPQLVSAEVYKKKIRFHISRTVVNQMSARKVTHVGGILLTATVFEGGSGDYSQPKAIPGAAVTLIGLGEHGTQRADNEGNIRLEKVPAHSELLVQVSAPGYHPTLAVVPTFDGDVYTTLYLLARDKVSDISHYFTKEGQLPSKSTLIGRVFDPVKRTPLPEQQYALAFRKQPPLYFGSLPDPSLKSTTKSGLFGFFNLAPSFRTLNRVEASARSILLNLLPDFGYYVELGRGGLGKLKAKLFDPFHNQPPAGKITVVGEPNFSTVTGAGGRFEIGGIDLPPGLLTLEVESEEYPKTWHSVPWNNRYQNEVHKLFMMENQIIKDGAASAAKVSLQNGKGSVVGGAETSFFNGIRQCVTVMLVASDGRSIGREHGPFPLHQTSAKDGALCLTGENPGFAFFNLPTGEYLLKWVNAKGFAFRTHVVRVGQDRVSVVVN